MGERGRKGLLLLALLVAGSIVAALPAAVHARIRHLHRPSCVSFEFRSTGPTAETGALDPTVTSMFAVLRRPVGVNDQLPPLNPLSEDLGYQLRSYFPASIRQIASDPEGERYFLIAGFERGFHIPPARCLPKQARRHRAQLVAEQRKRESQPVYCIEDIGPHRPQYGGASCQPFASIQTGGSLIATAQSTSDVIELVPDGVATVRLRYRSGTVITASVANNAFDFTPPQRPIKEAGARVRRLFQTFSRTHTHLDQSRAERLLVKRLREAFSQLTPATVEWLGVSGQPIRSFQPRPDGAATVLGSVIGSSTGSGSAEAISTG
jgi:hypothetical protein